VGSVEMAQKSVIYSNKAPVKPLKAVKNRHSGQAKRDPESRIFKLFWIPAPAPDPIRGSPE
jgi:hypothetical protein